MMYFDNAMGSNYMNYAPIGNTTDRGELKDITEWGTMAKRLRIVGFKSKIKKKLRQYK